jgi:ankyrin repeat protein
MGRADIVNRLLDRGATVQSGDELDFALNQAKRGGHAEVIACLLSRGAQWGERDAIDLEF